MIDSNIKKEQESKALDFIALLFENHGITCLRDGDELVFEKQQINIQLQFFERESKISLIQLDVKINYGIGEDIVESLVGIDDSFEIACQKAVDHFATNCFHVILAAFFTPKFDDQITKYNYTVKNKKYEIIAGSIFKRGYLEDEDNSYDWFEQFKKLIKNQELDTGFHWVRLFYSQVNFETTVCEVLLDNEYWIPIQTLTETFNFPSQEDFYSFRLFMIINNGVDAKRVAKFVGSSLVYDDVFETLSKMGLSSLDIEKSYAFIPEAFGRVFAKQTLNLNGGFSNDAGLINDNKDNIDIDLTKEPIYNQALQIAQELDGKAWSNTAKQLAMQSACMNSINNALNQGEEIEDIDCSRFYSCFYIPLYPKKQIVEKKPLWKFW